MAAYPTDPCHSAGSSRLPVTGIRTELAEDGTVRSRAMYSAPTYRFELIYDAIDSTEMAALTAHYASDYDAAFALTYDGTSYTVHYEDPGIEIRRIGGSWYSATVHLIGRA